MFSFLLFKDFGYFLYFFRYLYIIINDKIGVNLMVFLCLKIFFVRILDVSLGTIRTIITVKGRKLLASLIGFFEVAVWFLVVKEAINTDSQSLWIMVSYAGGYVTGTYIGGLLAEKFIKGNLGVQVITSEENINLVKNLRDEGYAVSVLDVKGHEEPKKYMLFIEIDKKNFNNLETLIKKLDPKAFIVVNETKYVQNGFIK